MNAVTPFRFDTHALRVQLDEAGQAWFNANDVCAALDLANPRDALSKHVDAEDVAKRDTPTSGGVQSVSHINESGLYALILGSTKPEAKRFKRWVTSEVLPSIRKTGSYTAPTPPRRARTLMPQPVRDLLLIGKAMSRVKGVSESVAMAYTLDAIERATGLPTGGMSRALPTVAPEEAATLNATQVGEPLHISGRAANALLERVGLQVRGEGKQWKLTEAGTAFGETKPFHRNGHSGYEIRWKPMVVEVLRKHQASTEGRA